MVFLAILVGGTLGMLTAIILMVSLVRLADPYLAKKEEEKRQKFIKDWTKEHGYPPPITRVSL